ncbi:hypothetical protein D3C73_842870 [compost metagenome]
MRVNRPAPDLVRPPTPEIALPSVRSLPPCIVMPLVPTVIRLASVSPPVLACKMPPLTVRMPLPKVALSLNCASPPLRVVAPLTSGPCNVHVPLLISRLLKLM